MAELSPQYYTRFHIWQSLVRNLTTKGWTPVDVADAAELGWDFVWRDGGDVFEPEEEENVNQLTLIKDEDPMKGTYL